VGAGVSVLGYERPFLIELCSCDQVCVHPTTFLFIIKGMPASSRAWTRLSLVKPGRHC